jgi:PadR family transcriptional regulator, regulatory protein AphA
MTARTGAARTTRLTLTEYAVLGLLGQLDRPVSGYELKKLVDSSVGYIWQPSKTQLYAVLPRLVEAGFATRREVRQRDRPDKQLYRIKEAGRAAMREWLDRDEETSDPDRSILVLKLFFGHQGSREALVRQVAAFREAYARRLATYERKPLGEGESCGYSDEFTRLTLRYGIARARAAVRWADAALEELT